MAPLRRDDRDAAEGHPEQDLMQSPLRARRERFSCLPSSALRPRPSRRRKLMVDTRGQGFTEITREASRFIAEARAKDGALLLFVRHTSASLVIQENADPDVRTDLASALDRLAPARCRLGPRRRRARRHAGTCQDHAYRRIAPCPRDRWRARARHLAGYLCRRAPRRGRTGARSCCNSSAAGGDPDRRSLGAAWIATETVEAADEKLRFVSARAPRHTRLSEGPIAERRTACGDSSGGRHEGDQDRCPTWC